MYDNVYIYAFQDSASRFNQHALRVGPGVDFRWNLRGHEDLPTVISHDFESITTFSVTVSSGSLGIARPRYQIHRIHGAQVSAKRFREF